MGLKTFKPFTPGRRGKVGIDFKEVTRSRSSGEKSLTESLVRPAGRNNRGRITVFQKGCGHKRRYRHIDFKRNKMDIPGKVKAIEYDPNRTAYIALLHYKDGEKAYILAPQGLSVGDEVISSSTLVDMKLGNCLPLSAIPLGTEVHNVEMRPHKGGQLARSAGSRAHLVARSGKYCQIKMPSGEVRLILDTCRASIGALSNSDNENVKLGKAGASRWRGRRPHVRGMAMNPIDHPLGGGEGVGKGHHPVTPWGKPCKGYKTRRNKRTDAFIVKRRKK